MAQFLAGAVPPGLRIERSYFPVASHDVAQSADRQKAAATGRDFDPRWDGLFRNIEELHGGVRIGVGSIPEGGDGSVVLNVTLSSSSLDAYALSGYLPYGQIKYYCIAFLVERGH